MTKFIFSPQSKDLLVCFGKKGERVLQFSSVESDTTERMNNWTEGLFLPSFHKNKQALVSGFRVPGSFHVCWFIPGLCLHRVNPSAVPSSFTIKAHHSSRELSWILHHSLYSGLPQPLFWCMCACAWVCVYETCVLILSLLLDYKLFEAKARVFALCKDL